MTRRALYAPGGMRRRWAALLIAMLTAATVLVPVAGPASASGVQAPAKPSGLDAEMTAGSLVVSVDWDDVAGATEYRVRWRRSGPGQALNDGLRPTSSQTDITVADVGSWVVRVVACNAAGCGRPAAESFETEPAPEPVPTTTTTTTVPVTTATVPVTTTTVPVTTTTMPVTTTTAPAPVTTTTAPAVGLAVAVSAAAEVPVREQLILSADITGAPAGVPGYRWEMSYGGGWWFTLDSSATASYLASSPETVQFRVTVWYPTGESATSPTASVAFVAATPATTTTTTTTQPPAPTQPPARPTGLDTTTTAGSLSVDVDWDDMTGADSYTVQWRRRGAGHALNVGLTPTASNATITVADVGRWVVRVQACNAVGCSAATAAGFETEALEPPAAPNEFEVDADDGLAVKASWDDTQGATRYKLEWRSLPETGTLGRSLGKSVGNNDGLPGDSLQTATASATANVAGAGMWQFLLSACNDGGCSAPTVRTVTVRNTTDYDSDNDGLIDINNAAKLNAVRWDLDGNGTVAAGDQASYSAAFPGAVTGMGCPSAGCNGYELRTNINLNVAPYNTGAGWDPIGVTYNAVFEGNGFTIANLRINGSPADDVGLFAHLGSNAKVRNLGLTNARITLQPVTSNHHLVNIGVLAGRNQGLVVAAYSTGTLNCVSTSTAYCSFLGGLIGRSTGSAAEIRRSYSAVDLLVSGGNDPGAAGGLVGDNSGAGAKIVASYATGNVNVPSVVGGLVGFNRDSGSIVASYSIGTVTASSKAGGLVGENLSSATVTNSYYSVGTSGQVDTGKGEPKASHELITPTGYDGIYAAWNLNLDGVTGLDNPWRFGNNRQYPGLVDVNDRVRRPANPVLVDYDRNNNGLIEIRGDNNNLNGNNNADMAKQLNAIRWDLNANGKQREEDEHDSISDADWAKYTAAFPNAAAGMGCRSVDHDGNSQTPNEPVCTGYELTADIDLGVAPYSTGNGWASIGSSADGKGFEGNFVGHGRTIANLTILNNAGQGLFGGLGTGATVRNLGLTDASISLTDRRIVGVLAGGIQGRSWGIATVEDVYSTGTLTCTAGCDTIGGLVGWVGNYIKIRRSYSSVDVWGPSTSGWAGGLVGASNAQDGTDSAIENSYATGNVTAGRIVGGLVGQNAVRVIASYASGNVTGTRASGAGQLGEVGGLIGQNAAKVIASYSIGRVSAPATVTYDSQNVRVVGGLIGRNTGTVTHSHYNIGAAGQDDSGKGDHKTTVELVTPNRYSGIYTNWNVDLDNADGDDNISTGGDNPWHFGNSRQYPGLRLKGGRVHRPTLTDTDFVDYDTDNDGLIEIDSPAKLNAIRWDLDGNGPFDESAANSASYLAAFPYPTTGMGCRYGDHDGDRTTPNQPFCKGYELTADIDLDVTPYNAGAGWVPIGVDGGIYRAVLEGSGHAISGLKIRSDQNDVGLFSALGSNAEVRDLGIVGPDIESVYSASHATGRVGALASLCRDCAISGVHVSGGSVRVTGGASDGTTTFRVGGLVGEFDAPNAGAISVSSASASVAKAAGAAVDVSIGGLVGHMKNISNSISASFATGAVTNAGTLHTVGELQIGGLVGYMLNGAVTASYSVGKVANTGAIAAAKVRSGGLVGRKDGGSVNFSFYNSDKAGQSDDSGKGRPRSTAALITPTTYSGIFSAWNLNLDGVGGNDNPWRFGTAQQYPGLVFDGVVHRPRVPNLACTLGPGPDWRNPDSPCGTGPDDRPENYKDIDTMDDWDEIERTPDPGWTYFDGLIWVDRIPVDIDETPGVRFVDADDVNADCASSATACRIRWNHIKTRFGEAVNFDGVYRIYLWADLKADPAVDTAVCELRSKLVSRDRRGKPNEDPWTNFTFNLTTPAGLPAGCVVDEWVVAVVPELSFNRNRVTVHKVGGAALAYRAP